MVALPCPACVQMSRVFGSCVTRAAVDGGTGCNARLEPRAVQGEDGTAEVSASLAQVASILHESFDPIIDLVTGQDLLPVMVYAQELGAWDYTGMYSAVLQHQVRCCCAVRLDSE